MKRDRDPDMADHYDFSGAERGKYAKHYAEGTNVVVLAPDVAKALNSLHEAFFLSDRKIAHVFLVGTGLIGTALTNQMHDQFDKLSNESKLEIKITFLYQ